MPVNFSQQEALVPSLTAGAAAAEMAAKTFPQIAEIYANAARLRASGGGGGGGGRGGVVYSGGPVQQLGSTDGGAFAGVQRQADRDQQTAIVGAEINADLPGRHIKMQQEYQTARAKQAQDNQQRMFQALNPDLVNRGPGPAPRPVREPEPVAWTSDDQHQFDSTEQQITDIRRANESGSINNDTYYKLIGPSYERRAELLKKQRAAQESAEKQRHQAEYKQDMHQTGLMVARGRGLLSNMPSAPSDIPGMPPDRYMPDARGNWVNVNEKKQLEFQKAVHAREQKAIDAAAKQNDEKDASKTYHQDRAQAVSELKSAQAIDVPTEAAIRARILEIRAHREELRTGKAPQAAANPQADEEKFNKLMGALLGSQPAATTRKAPERTNRNATQGNGMMADQFGGMGGSW